MKYRDFGTLDWKVSALGFGAMRMPLKGKEPSDVDEPESIRMIRYAIDHGVNYVDTAYPYHGGVSERVVGRALKDGYREKIKLATKLPVRMAETAADFDRILNEQLERLDTTIDFYLLHGLNAQSWSRAKEMGIIPWAEDAMAKGRFGRLSFSFHDKVEAFKNIVDDYDDWGLCQVQYNFMDINNQAGTEGVKYAADKGLPVVVMEPLRGGKLAKTPDEVAMVWDSAKQKRSAVEWALQWVWNQPEVSMALSGMSTMEQVIENVDIADRSGPGIFTGDELLLFDKAREAYHGLIPIPCTSCGYCIPCPNGVEIPRIFQIYNECIMYDDPRTGRFRYRGSGELKEEARADRCTECGECMDACPQEIEITDWLKKVHELLGPAK